MEIADEGGFTPVVEAAYHGHETCAATHHSLPPPPLFLLIQAPSGRGARRLGIGSPWLQYPRFAFPPRLNAAWPAARAGRRLLKWLVGRGADLDVRGVALGPADTAGGQRTQNGPFTPLEWARRQGHLSCAAVRTVFARPSPPPSRRDGGGGGGREAELCEQLGSDCARPTTQVLAHATSAPQRAAAKLGGAVRAVVGALVDGVVARARQVSQKRSLLSRRGRGLPANASGLDTHCDWIRSRFDGRRRSGRPRTMAAR
eukprot:COSAG01_NODE_8452_length_2781_cov_3.000000_1_plen_258_part_00